MVQTTRGTGGSEGVPTASALSRTHSITYVSTAMRRRRAREQLEKQLQQEKRCGKWRKLQRKWLTSKEGRGEQRGRGPHTYAICSCSCSCRFIFSFTRRSHEKHLHYANYARDKPQGYAFKWS